MTTYTKTILIIAGLFLIPAILISQKYTSADIINFSTDMSSNPSSPVPTIDDSNNSSEDISSPEVVISPSASDADIPASFPGIDINIDDNQAPLSTFLFFDANTFPSIDSWSKLIPDITPPGIIPPILPTDTNGDQIITVTSLFEAWQDIKDKPIGVITNEDEQAKVFEERKQIFDAWFEKEWQAITDPITSCDNWWCIDPPTWTKTITYNLQKFDFSYDWAWNQFSKDHL